MKLVQLIVIGCVSPGCLGVVCKMEVSENFGGINPWALCEEKMESSEQGLIYEMAGCQTSQAYYFAFLNFSSG